MSDVQELLARQAQWQASRKDLSWADKIRMVEAIRDSILELRRSARSTGIEKRRPGGHHENR